MNKLLKLSQNVSKPSTKNSSSNNSAVAANLQEELSGFLMNGDEMSVFVRVLFAEKRGRLASR